MRTLVRVGAGVLRSAGIAEARLEAELILSDVLAVPRSALRLEPFSVVDPLSEGRFRRRLERRRQREPLQYVLGKAWFRDLTLRIDPRVLIPRPETEILVGAVLDWAVARGRWGGVADIGTGSGAIAISLATEGSFERIVATDLSLDALEVARTNAEELAPDRPIEFRHQSLLAALHEGERFDVIVSNPPYVDEADAVTLAQEIRDWEPSEALFAKAGGLAVLFALADGGADRLEPGGLLALECGAGQAAAVAERMRDHGLVNVEILRDLAGVERIVLGERTPDPHPAESLR
ncbi:MAG: peptide chain release factor N(5)-glutamine methyltransferase [Gemmatimonadetes bacterium]|nr:peptide chain release factor N(5)-glutamine methyltransferase [Gemmatimonadota bacterium]